MTGIHHVAVICSDYQRAKDFYVGVLGLRVVAEEFREARGSWKVDLELPDGGRLELFTFPGAPKRVDRPEALGLRHLAFRVGDLEGVIGELKANGVEVEEVRVDGGTGKRFTFLKDPDGLPLELYEG